MSSSVPTTPELVLPAPHSATERITVQTLGRAIVFVGANGSGKSRLGAWFDLDSPQNHLTHRVAAQKSLDIPAITSPSSLDVAEKHLLYGWESSEASVQHKRGSKWGSRPIAQMQNDFHQLLTFLFTEEFESSIKYRQQARGAPAATPGPPPDTKLDILKRIWESVLPHRELVVQAGKIEARAQDGGSAYPAGEMSDGERVVFYLIGQSLAARQGGLLIIDEPEVHLHRSIQSRLWDAIEAERPDCLFVYLTHDLDFAATRVNATKIWLRTYEGGVWDWSVVPEMESFPERLLLEVLGSRKPVMFVEGERESLDVFLFSKLFPNYAVVPCGPASTVIHATTSFAALRSLHNLDCAGIVDRDYRSDEHIQLLRGKRVFCLEVSEVENLLLTEQVLRAVASSLHMTDVDERIGRVRALVFKHMTNERDRLISAIVAGQIENSLRDFDAKAVGSAALTAALTSLTSHIDVERMFTETAADVDDILARQDYTEALKIYNNKGLVPAVAPIFEFRAGGLLDHIRRLCASKDNTAIIAALRAATSALPKS